MIENFIIGANVFFTPMGISMVFLGVTIGIVFGVIPGLTATMAIALLLPVTHAMAPIAGMILLVGIYVGGMAGILVPAILINIPGSPASVATCFDGYPLAQKGQSVKALGLGLICSAIGTIFATLVLIALAPFLARIAIMFGNYEYFAVALFSLTMISGLAGKSLIKGLMSGLFGAMFATVGLEHVGNVVRFTFGVPQLLMGFDILPVLIGLFAVSVIIETTVNVKTETKLEVIDIDLKNAKGFGFSMKEFWGQRINLLRSAVIGTGIGILPGIGGATANMLAYSVAKNQSKYPEKFGTGVIDGIVAPETSNSATVGTAFVPMLALGIPADTVTAMLLGGLIMKGITPGPLMFIQHVDLVYAIFITLIVACFVMVLVQFYGIRVFAALLRVPKHYLLPAVFLFCIIGSFGIRTNVFDIWAVLFFGIVAFVMSKGGIPLPPFILGFILGPIMEINLIRGMMLAQGNFLMFFTEPIAVFFFAATAVSLVFAIRRQIINLKQG